MWPGLVTTLTEMTGWFGVDKKGPNTWEMLETFWEKCKFMTGTHWNWKYLRIQFDGVIGNTTGPQEARFRNDDKINIQILRREAQPTKTAFRVIQASSPAMSRC